MGAIQWSPLQLAPGGAPWRGPAERVRIGLGITADALNRATAPRLGGFRIADTRARPPLALPNVGGTVWLSGAAMAHHRGAAGALDRPGDGLSITAPSDRYELLAHRAGNTVNASLPRHRRLRLQSSGSSTRSPGILDGEIPGHRPLAGSNGRVPDLARARSSTRRSFLKTATLRSASLTRSRTQAGFDNSVVPPQIW